MVVLATVCILGCAKEPAGLDTSNLEPGLTGPTVKVLPELESISKVTVFGMIDEDGKTLKRFQLPRESWQKMLQALQPARLDPSPANWVMLGYLDIELTDKTLVSVHLYHTYEEVGAFSIEKNQHERPYFRGGNSDSLSKVLHRAYAHREAN